MLPRLGSGSMLLLSKYLSLRVRFPQRAVLPADHILLVPLTLLNHNENEPSFVEYG